LIDLFAAEYKWTTKVILQHTYHQLRKLGDEIADRRYRERTLSINSVRVAYHADRSEYDRFIQQLDPRIMRELDEDSHIVTPEGMAVKEDF